MWALSANRRKTLCNHTVVLSPAAVAVRRRRVFCLLKKGGVFCGCFYIAGAFARTDWFVRRLYVPKGFFTPPFETKESLARRLHGLYREVKVHNVNAEGIFCCVK